MHASKRILIVDDEPQMLGLLRTILEAEDFDVVQACDGAEMRAALRDRSVDLITLDLGLPGTPGMELTRDLCLASDTPIIVVSGRNDAFDRVLALELGADDYIVKPFNNRELAARVRAVLRRSQGGRRHRGVADAGPGVLTFHHYTLNMQTRKLSGGSATAMTLTSAECRLIEVLVENAGKVCTRDELTWHIKGRSWSPLDRSLDTLVARLRRKIEAQPDRPELVMSVRGVGYMMTTT